MTNIPQKRHSNYGKKTKKVCPWCETVHPKEQEANPHYCIARFMEQIEHLKQREKLRDKYILEPLQRQLEYREKQIRDMSYDAYVLWLKYRGIEDARKDEIDKRRRIYFATKEEEGKEVKNG